MNDDLEINIKPLEKLLKALKGKQPSGRIGILQNNGRTDGTTNALVGACHEFGTTKLPVRSFLRQPLTDHLNKQLENSGAFDKDTLNNVINEGSVMPWLSKVMVVAEAIVSEAFDTQGYGKWPSWSTPGYTNNTGMVLVDTSQLRNSITSEIK